MKRVPNDESISQRTLDHIYAALRNLDAGVVGDEFDLSEIQELLDEPCSVEESDLRKDS
ncbi:MAG TPA: hypothetical protein VM890_17280 [Longimicrobium sp.]|jgi:hypothetical protein|nr:hypothetical protein [Longimicrobium sp.]